MCGEEVVVGHEGFLREESGFWHPGVLGYCVLLHLRMLALVAGDFQLVCSFIVATTRTRTKPAVR